MKWTEPAPVTVSRSLREAIGGHPLVAETLVRRGYATAEMARAFLDPNAYMPTASESLPGLEAAVERIEEALTCRELICVWGDFDVDGQTATTLLVSTLRDLGGEVIYHIPVRETESHGLRRPWLDRELAKGVRLLLTCDTGIDAHEAVSYAQSQGVDVVITDHHEPALLLPQARAIVNPHFLPPGHPLSALPGVGVAYKLAEALYVRAARPRAAHALLDLVALGIVADVAVQQGDTRYLLQRGLQVLRRTQRLGLQELMRVAGVMADQVDEETLGFALGPRLNAIGRLDDANIIVEFLTTNDLAQARTVASQLEALNARRKRVCDQVFAAAEARIERDPTLLEGSVLLLADATWPAGIIGIVANRLMEKYHRPTLLFAAPPGELARGSARSVPGCHITDAIATQESLVASFGGHAMAAGVAIDPERLESFRRGLDRVLASQITAGGREPDLEVHGYVALSELSLELVSDLQRLAPFGSGNPALVLAAQDVAITGRRPLGREAHHLRLTVEDAHHVERQMVWWNWRGADVPEGRVDIAFTARVQAFRGEVDVQLVWQSMRAAAGSEVQLQEPESRVELEVVDQRGCADPRALLASLHERYLWLTVWAEGQERKAVSGNHRLMLGPSETLVIWSCPPGVEVLRAGLRRVGPSRVILVGCGCAEETARGFLEQLAGLAKYSLKAKNGRIEPAQLAAVMGHREVTVKRGLALLEAQGLFSLAQADDLALKLETRSWPDAKRAAALREELLEVLAETLAYRRYFQRGDKDRLLAGLGAAGENKVE
jgi:single-stranded-DNA-specific exonuclease